MHNKQEHFTIIVIDNADLFKCLKRPHFCALFGNIAFIFLCTKKLPALRIIKAESLIILSYHSSVNDLSIAVPPPT